MLGFGGGGRGSKEDSQFSSPILTTYLSTYFQSIEKGRGAESISPQKSVKSFETLIHFYKYNSIQASIVNIFG